MAEMIITEYDPTEHEGLWKDFLRRYPDATPYHTREWANVIRLTFGFVERSLVAMYKEELCAILPLWEVNKNTVVNAPWRDRADLLGTRHGTTAMLDRLVSIGADVVLKGWERPEIPEGYVRHDYWVTSVLDLGCGKESLWKRIRKNVGRNIRKAEKAGVVVSSEISSQNLQHFYELFRITRKRLGVPIYPFNLFHNIFTHLGGELARLYIAFLQEKPIASVIYLDGNRGSTYAYGAWDHRYGQLRPNDLVHWTAISDSIDRGKPTVDMGADSPGQKGLLSFKAKWGARQYVLPTLRKSNRQVSPDVLDFSSDRYRFHRRLLSLMPARLLGYLGKHMTRRSG